MGRKELKDGEETFSWSDDAMAALDHPLGNKAHVVSSSRKFGSDHPPHPQARDRYRKILAQGSDITNSVKKRFKCTAGARGDDPEDIVFKFTSSGPAKAALTSSIAISTPTASGGGGYGGV
ncbi:MAG: hypothetical protein IH991_23710 [Planctomycetes bacterium]|nr:hypothetical protein [Planctomycetota bacterium]